MSHEGSCLINKVRYFTELDAEECELLSRLEKIERSHDRGDLLYRTGQPIKELFVVRRGWLFTAMSFPGGRRQILQLYFPGDIVGLAAAPLVVSPYELQAATDVTLCPFQKPEIDNLLKNSPRLTALCFNLAMVDQLVLMDRVRALGRMSARERIAHFLLEILSRLRLTNPRITSSFRLPLTQAQIADALGLTNVYVSKSIKQLEEEGLVSIENGSVILEQETELRRICDFRDRYSSFEVSWLPDDVEEESLTDEAL